MELPTAVRKMDEEGGIAHTHYRYGEIVKCQNLTSTAGQKFNGAVAIIDTWDRETDKFVVLVVNLSSGEPVHTKIKLRRATVVPLSGTTLPEGHPLYASSVADFSRAVLEEFPGFLVPKAMDESSLSSLLIVMLESSTYDGMCGMSEGDKGGDVEGSLNDADNTESRFRRFEMLLLGACRLLWSKTDPSYHLSDEMASVLPGGRDAWKSIFQKKVVQMGQHDWDADVRFSEDNAVQARAFGFACNFGTYIGAQMWRVFRRYSWCVVCYFGLLKMISRYYCYVVPDVPDVPDVVSLSVVSFFFFLLLSSSFFFFQAPRPIQKSSSFFSPNADRRIGATSTAESRRAVSRVRYGVRRVVSARFWQAVPRHDKGGDDRHRSKVRKIGKVRRSHSFKKAQSTQGRVARAAREHGSAARRSRASSVGAHRALLPSSGCFKV